jgi:two-component system cell cycle sensor histidine kinase/response regulator CckA
MKADVVFTLENAGWPALLVDGTGVILRANQAAVRILGPVVEGEAPLLSAIWSPENGSTAEQFLAQWERSPTATLSLKFRVKGGGVSSYSASICSFTKDGQKFFLFQLLPGPSSEGDTIFQIAESSLVQKQKLDCALQLARTVSLDFNNALTSILGHTSLLLSLAEPKHPWRKSLLEVEKSAAKAAEIANDLAAFSRQDREPRGQSAGNLNALVQRSVELFQNSRPDKLEWTMQLGRKLFAAKFDEAKMQQVFLKIIENAVESVEAGGRITVQTRNVELAEPAQDRELRLAVGTYVCVEINDNGCGIAPEVLPRIFEPFFTTKRGGNHRGLGLAFVYGIVTNHGGGVAVSSQPGGGTSVRVYLPAEKKIMRDSDLHSGDLNGNETILMVDDEDLMLTMAQTVLSAFGYRVLTANSGQKAIEIFSRGDTAIDLLITDLVMPAMSGRELAEHVNRLSPTTRILCTSGFVRPLNENDSMTYLQKPFTSQELLVKVRQTLTTAVEGC